jgi:hypothetical protein
MPGVFPDYPDPVIRNTDTGRELSMRWGMPPPPRILCSLAGELQRETDRLSIALSRRG